MNPQNTQNTQNHHSNVETETESARELEASPLPDSALCTPHSALSTPPSLSQFPPVKPFRRFTGKVARLPNVVRIEINGMLDDGCFYKEIIAKLEELGYPGFSY